MAVLRSRNSVLGMLQEFFAHYYLRNMLLVGVGGVDYIFLHVNRFVRQQVRSTLYGVCSKYSVLWKDRSSNRLVLSLEFPVVTCYQVREQGLTPGICIYHLGAGILTYYPHQTHLCSP
jgi:hypothetical protein